MCGNRNGILLKSKSTVFSCVLYITCGISRRFYIENMAAYEQLFMDADKYRIIQRALAERLYQELHNHKK